MAFAEVHRSNDVDKNFAHTVITWEIENFSLILSKEMRIHSPEITLLGPVETSWKIHLEVPYHKNGLELKLEMLPNEFIKRTVHLYWAYCLLDETEKGSFIVERKASLEPGSILSLDSIDHKHAYEIASKKKYDNLILKYRMLILFNQPMSFPECNVYGVKYLSSNLSKLPESYLHPDTTTTVMNCKYSLHKAMLFFRGTKLVRFMEQSPIESDNYTINKEVAATNVMKYLYTGDLNYVFDETNLTLADYIEQLEIPEVQDVYSPQKITAITRTEIQEYETIWDISNIGCTNDTIVGPEFKIDIMDSSFQFRMDVKESEDRPRKKYMTVEVMLTKSELELALSIEFAFGNDKNQILCTRKIHGILTSKNRLSINLLEDDCPEIKELFMCKNLSITVNFNRSIGNSVSFIAGNEKPQSTKVSNEKSLLSLSESLGLLKDTGVYSDIYFRFDEQVLKAHKFLLAARCVYLKKYLQTYGDVDSVIVNRWGIEDFDIFLHYLYTGTVKDNDADNIIKLYQFRNKLHIDGLRDVPTALPEMINDANMLRILIFADEIEDNALRNAAYNYVVSKGLDFQSHPDHSMFMFKTPHLYREVFYEFYPDVNSLAY